MNPHIGDKVSIGNNGNKIFGELLEIHCNCGLVKLQDGSTEWYELKKINKVFE